MKHEILSCIYTAFTRWSVSDLRACTEGCSCCCTQNVVITALEGEDILDFIIQRGQEQWCADRLRAAAPGPPPPLTTNEYAAACLEQQAVEDDKEPAPLSRCPFLLNDLCAIYPVRPFACRCFQSEAKCQPGTSAVQPRYYLAAATAMMQLIEHLGQNEYWGNMFDVLLALCDMNNYREIAHLLSDPVRIVQARLRTRRALPLPGFLLLDDEITRISPLLEEIFTTRIEDRSIRDILNGMKTTPRS